MPEPVQTTEAPVVRVANPSRDPSGWADVAQRGGFGLVLLVVLWGAHDLLSAIVRAHVDQTARLVDAVRGFERELDELEGRLQLSEPNR